MTTSGTQLVQQFDAISKIAPAEAAPGPVGLAMLDEVKIETVESSDTAATLRSTGPDGTEKTLEFVKHEGKWLPKDMVSDWDRQMADAKQALESLPQQLEQARPMVTMVTGSVSGALTPLQSAETQEQFNSAVEGVQQMAMAMFMQQMGGGLGGPPGELSVPLEEGGPEVPQSQNIPIAPPETEPEPAAPKQ